MNENRTSATVCPADSVESYRPAGRVQPDAWTETMEDWMHLPGAHRKSDSELDGCVEPGCDRCFDLEGVLSMLVFMDTCAMKCPRCGLEVRLPRKSVIGSPRSAD